MRRLSLLLACGAKTDTFERRPGDGTLTLVDSCHVGAAAVSIAACANQAPTIEAISQCVG